MKALLRRVINVVNDRCTRVLFYDQTLKKGYASLASFSKLFIMRRARPPLMRAALTALGIDISGVDPRAFESPIFGHGRVVGEVRVIDNLLSS